MIPYLKLSAAHMMHHWVTSLVIVVMIAISTAAVLLWQSLESDIIRRAVSESNRVDAVVGAKGSPLQLVLSSVYHLDAPTGNIPLAALDTVRSMPGVRLAIPISLGDAYRSYRIVGTTHAFLDTLFQTTPKNGAGWTAPFEAVIGAAVAAQTGLVVDGTFVSSHGLGVEGEAHEHAPFTVVGILPATGSVLDELILTSLESVWLAHGHDQEEDHHQHHHGHHSDKEHTLDDVDITAVLVLFSNPYVRFHFTQDINANTAYLAASPVWEVNKVLTWLGFGFQSIRLLGGALVALLFLAMTVLLGLHMNERMSDMTVLLNSGFSKGEVFWIPMVDSMLLLGIGLLTGVATTQVGVAWLLHYAAEILPRIALDWHALLPAVGVVLLALGAILGLLSAARVVRRSVPDLISSLPILILLVLPISLDAQAVNSDQEQAWKAWAPLSQVSYELRRFRGEQYYWPVVSEEVKAMHGKTITIRGYLILQLAEFRTRQFYLSKVPESQCFFCGGAGPESLMEVFAKSPVPKTSRPITVRGRLVVNTDDPEKTMYALVDAEWVRD